MTILLHTKNHPSAVEYTNVIVRLAAFIIKIFLLNCYLHGALGLNPSF